MWQFLVNLRVFFVGLCTIFVQFRKLYVHLRFFLVNFKFFWKNLGDFLVNFIIFWSSSSIFWSTWGDFWKIWGISLWNDFRMGFHSEGESISMESTHGHLREDNLKISTEVLVDMNHFFVDFNHLLVHSANFKANFQISISRPKRISLIHNMQRH